MNKVPLSAEEIAKQQLIQAIKMWHKEEYISSITLAGAAEEILGKRLRNDDKVPSFDSFKNLVMLIDRNEEYGEKKHEKRVSSVINYAKNKLKHHAGDEPLFLDLKEEATSLLDRAISNFIDLTGLVHDEMYKFLDETSNS